MDGRVLGSYGDRVPGGIVALAAIVARHRAAFEFDLLDRLGLTVAAVRALPASLARAYFHGLMVDPRTHVYAAMTQQTFVGSHSDMALVLLAQAVLNIGRKPGEKPLKLPGPYMGADRGKKARQQYVPPKEKERLKERLRTYSSIPD